MYVVEPFKVHVCLYNENVFSHSISLFGLAEDLCQRREEVPAAHPGAAEKGAQQLPGVTEARVQVTQRAAQRGTSTASRTRQVNDKLDIVESMSLVANLLSYN